MCDLLDDNGPDVWTVIITGIGAEHDGTYFVPRESCCRWRLERAFPGPRDLRVEALDFNGVPRLFVTVPNRGSYTRQIGKDEALEALKGSAAGSSVELSPHPLADGKDWTCKGCERTAKISVYPVHCSCGYSERSPLPLGDWVAKGLKAIGIEQKNSCGCSKRQQWLNQVGSRIA